MLYTVTFNPSLDYVVTMDKLLPGDINRTTDEKLYPGGKGINVSIVLHNLGLSNVALGFTAGMTGRTIEAMLADQGCQCDFIHTDKGFSRINTKIRALEETAINGGGPKLTNVELEALLLKLETLKPDDFLILAGSIPSCLPSNTYENILECLQGKGINFVVDATGQLLAKVLKYHPWLIKPNNEELAEIVNRPLLTEEDLILAAKELQARGAQNILVSRAHEGALLLAADGQLYKQPAFKGQLVNSVGAGDSMVAGFIAGYLKSRDYQTALLTGSAAGSASAFKDWLATAADINELLRREPV